MMVLSSAIAVPWGENKLNGGKTTGYGSKPVKTHLFSPKQLGIKDAHPPNHHIDGVIYMYIYIY